MFTFDRGDAHPRVTGYNSTHAAFTKLVDARAYMREHGVVNPKEVIKDGAGETTPVSNSASFYAVAHGKQPGIHEDWKYESPTLCSSYRLLTRHSGTEPEVKKVKNTCHKRFRTLSQAEAFIEDWKDSVADTWRRAIKEGLDQGLRPKDMKFSTDGILRNPDIESEGESLLDVVNLKMLTLKDEKEQS